tara:strand:- start:443 stop:1435 length:993 start_codon:yes stop_codon:yes gene_type:complete
MDNKINDEFDLIDLFKKIYISRKFIFYLTLFFLILGIIVSILLPVKYSSSTIFIPQKQESTKSSLSGVASLVGINLGNLDTGGEIPSSMYPQVAESPKFKRFLLSTIIDEKKNLTLKDYLIDYYKILEDDNQNSTQIYVSKLEEECFILIDNILSTDVNQKDGFVKLTTYMVNPSYSAIVAKSAKEILQNIIIENRIQSARENLSYVQEQLAEKKLEFDKIQNELTYYSDSNLNSINSFIINKKNKLEAEFKIISDVVTDLSIKVEQAKLQVTKDTPVFSTIKEAVIPNKKYSPKRVLVIAISVFFGILFSIVYTLIKDPLKKALSIIKS